MNMSGYDFNKITEIIAQREKIDNYKLEYPFCCKNENVKMSNLESVCIMGTNKVLNLVYKYSDRDPKAHELLPFRYLFTNEMNYYEHTFPVFKKFQEEYRITNPFVNSPKYYGGIDEPLNELLALEDLKVQNYAQWYPNEPMNRPHLESTLKTLAKLHGTSFAMRQLKGKMFSEITHRIKCNSWYVLVSYSQIYEQLKKVLHNMLDIFDPITEKEYLEKMDYFRKNAKEMVDALICNPTEYDVILHGDCWCNNVLYKYKDLNDRRVPVDVKLLDFQMARLGSVVSDLSFFFYTIAGKDAFDGVDHFLKVYHDALSEHLRGFNLDVDEVYPFQKLLQHWSETAKFGLLMSFIQRKILMVKAEDALDIFKDPMNFFTNIHLSREKETLYRQQMKELIVHFVDREFI